MSQVVIVNDKDEVIGTMPKSQAHKDGTPHRIAVIYVENENGEILVQVRENGFLDHSAAGHVDPGETYEHAAYRELAEELGIKNVKLKRLGHGRSSREKYPGKIVSHVFDVFKCVAEIVEIQTDEVKDTFWAKPEDILKEMQDEKTKDKYCGAFTISLPIYLNT